MRKHQIWERSRTKSDLPHHGVRSHKTETKPMRRLARNVDPSMNWLWMLTMRATMASAESSTKKTFGLITPCGLAMSANRNARMSDPCVTIWPIDVGIGNKVGKPENARTFVNRATQTGSGLRMIAFARAPATARSAVSASPLMER